MYHGLTKTRVKLTAHQAKLRGQKFCEIKDFAMLAAFLKMEKQTLGLLAAHPQYHCFYLPKKSGKRRLIQTPRKRLKWVQERLSHYLQCVYFDLKPECAYGFIISPRDDESPRNIYTNACKHVGQAWVLNIDLKDFFHQLKTADLRELFLGAPFSFTTRVAECLAKLSTFENRLPMGAPTSPVISNFVCRELDAHLMTLAERRGWQYTRYADDLSFSTNKSFSDEHLEELTSYIQNQGFIINQEKIKLMSKKETPEITGLILKKDRPDVSDAFIDGIKDDIRVLNALAAPRMIQRRIFDQRPVEKLRKSIRGQINFVAFIRGREHKSVRKLRKRLADSLERG